MDYHIYMVDNSGRVLFSTTTRKYKTEINVGSYKKGIYLIIATIVTLKRLLNLLLIKKS